LGRLSHSVEEVARAGAAKLRGRLGWN
jgi:hypothetical protein